MRAKSFLDILTDEIRKELRAELRAEMGAEFNSSTHSTGPSARVAHDAPAAEFLTKASQADLWLSLHVPRFDHVVKPLAYRTQAVTGTRNASGNTKTNPRPRLLNGTTQTAPSSERSGAIQSAEQVLAAEFFLREGQPLNPKFTESEFKTAFRKLAKKLHPDRHAMAEQEVKDAFAARFMRLTECAQVLVATLTNVNTEGPKTTESYDSEFDAA